MLHESGPAAASIIICNTLVMACLAVLNRNMVNYYDMGGTTPQYLRLFRMIQSQVDIKSTDVL